MSKRMRTILIIGALAIAAYLIYRWWSSKQQSQGTGADTTGTGSNLNSLAPELVAGSQGPESGLNYTQGTETIDVSIPGAPVNQSQPPQPPGGSSGPPPISHEPCPYGFKRSGKICVPITVPVNKAGKCPAGHIKIGKKCVPVKQGGGRPAPVKAAALCPALR